MIHYVRLRHGQNYSIFGMKKQRKEKSVKYGGEDAGAYFTNLNVFPFSNRRI